MRKARGEMHGVSDLMEMLILAKKHDLSLPGVESAVSEKYYQMYQEIHAWKKAGHTDNGEKATEHSSRFTNLTNPEK